MSKINATYSSGYYIAPDVDFRKLEEQQRQEQRGKRKHGGADHGGDDNVKRQTFAIPFDLICEHCHRRIARGSHVYANRRATDKRYLDSIRIWELEILCRFCKGKYYLRTDPETPKDTGGYICEKGCKRVEGDFYSLNKQNQAAREEWEKAKAEAELNPLAALERENEAARELEERNRQIEEAVEERAGHDDGNLLTMLRSRPRRTEVRAAALDDDGDEDADDSGKPGTAPSSTSAEPASSPPSSSSTAFPLPKAFTLGGDGDGSGDEDEEDADERAFREFNEDMERRWRTLERQQRARQRQQEQQSIVAETTMPADEDELRRVLARYGGDRRATAEAVTTTLVQAQEPNVLQAPASASCPTPMTTSAPAVAPKKSSIKQNKFFVCNNDNDDDIDDADAEESLLARLRGPPPPKPAFVSAARATSAVSITAGATPCAQPASRFATPAGASQPPPPPRKCGSSLLRRLVDDEDDEDGAD
ncbi:conserved hypothetical protein [Leishmania infantum JPCM5]|uniref:Family_of_uncharacterized_function_(DUF572)_-_put ative n=2 Tax=Leishmania infantum TaxID=5671 RepID=A0A6L0XK15_LEIIN|nr:conserved hypothetical protein [Leishmania infantum JPCM5]CAC9508385.1 Family_of_uncharacterised_function_(DUF572)_-_putative [Leishmania infantum]CAM69690.1 conserved hypothetical protein [Leishmania infantum JPCM5]SUZ43630.1 Family_of_uncharacterised_function_(DUF572)_-_putative [Leishmania infantum]|eukprot:XP_001466648.1 conserved hypothetical protein [Leishmania infantum JPCM5]